MVPRSKPASDAAVDSTDVAIAVLRQFRQVLNAVKSHFQQVEKTVGIGGAQVWALSVVRDHPGIGVSALAKAMSIHQSTASNLVRTLIDREMVVAVKQGADRRAVQLNLLPAGANVLKNAPNKEDAYKYLNLVLQPDIQEMLAREFYTSPTNVKSKLTPDVAADVPVNGAGMTKIVQFDWAKVNPHLGEITDRWNREMK